MTLLSRLRSFASDRTRWPRIANRLVDGIAERPDGILGKFAARRYGRPAPGTPVTTIPIAPHRVLIAPVNYSGQGRAWAVSLSRESDIAAVNMAIEVPGGFAFEADLVVPVPVYQNDADWQRRQFDAVATSATHVLIEAQEPPFGRLMGRDTERQAQALLERGVSVAFLAHGTDIRLPSRHLAAEPWSHYAVPGVYVPRLEHLARHHREMLARLDRPTFVSTPDLLADLEGARWCPVVVDLERWAHPGSRVAQPGPLRVVHAPSVAHLKGTELIEPVVESLAAAGTIRWTLVSGVRSADMPAVFHGADVLLDQFRAGSYGVGAVEALAAGCLVVGHIREEVRADVLRLTGRDLPIVQATPDTLEHVLVDLAASPERVARLRTEGLEFVRSVHDGTASAHVLTSWIRSESP